MSRLRIGLLATIGVLGWPVWQWIALRFDDGTGEPWGLVPLLIAVAFGTARYSHEVPRWGLVAAGVAAGATLLLHASGAPPLLRAGMLFIALGLLATGGTRGWPGVVLLLLLSLPVVASLQFYAGCPLRVAAGFLAEAILSAGGAGITRDGLTLFHGDTPILIDAPCSGVQMLWCALVLHAALATRAASSLFSTLIGCGVTVALVVVANALRAGILILQESAIVPLPDSLHEGIGLAAFAVLAWAIVRVGGGAPFRPTQRHLIGLGGAAFAGLYLFATFALPAAPHPQDQTDFPGWPATFNGHALTPLPENQNDARFAEGFPGEIARLTDGRRDYLLRWMPRPTRQLHASADCLRASGFTVGARTVRTDADGIAWACYPASRNDLRLAIRERIYSADAQQTWTDVSAWYWEADSPCWAVTEISQRR